MKTRDEWEGVSGAPQPPLTPPDPAQLSILDAVGWPQRPAAPAVEQRGLPLPGTITARYAAWRATEEGGRIYAWLEQQAALGASVGVRRLSISGLVERCRATLFLPVNNDFRAELSREIEEHLPQCRGLFRERKRSAL